MITKHKKTSNRKEEMKKKGILVLQRILEETVLEA